MVFTGEMAPTDGRRKVVSGRSLRHRRIGKSRRAAVLAQVKLGEVTYEPTVRELARGHEVPESYVAEALSWSPEKRAAVADGKNPASIAKAISSRRRLPAPAPEPVPETLGEQLSRALRVVGNGKAA
jgi:hypothetical protein